MVCGVGVLTHIKAMLSLYGCIELVENYHAFAN